MRLTPAESRPKRIPRRFQRIRHCKAGTGELVIPNYPPVAAALFLDPAWARGGPEAASGPQPEGTHAKVVVIDRREAFITSANRTEAAQQRDIEVGVLLRDPATAMRLAEYFDGLERGGGLVRG